MAVHHGLWRCNRLILVLLTLAMAGFSLLRSLEILHTSSSQPAESKPTHPCWPGPGQLLIIDYYSLIEGEEANMYMFMTSLPVHPHLTIRLKIKGHLVTANPHHHSMEGLLGPRLSNLNRTCGVQWQWCLSVERLTDRGRNDIVTEPSYIICPITFWLGLGFPDHLMVKSRVTDIRCSDLHSHFSSFTSFRKLWLELQPGTKHITNPALGVGDILTKSISGALFFPGNRKPISLG